MTVVSRKSARRRRRGFRAGVAWVWGGPEALEYRRLLTTAVAWQSSKTFDQFTGGAAYAYGAGYDDGYPDFNQDGISDGSGLRLRPFFFGLQQEEQTDNLFDNDFGYLDITTAYKLGFNLGYYLSGANASSTYRGIFTYDVGAADSGGRTPVSTDVETVLGSLFSTSPQFGGYVDLAYGAKAWLDGRVTPIPGIVPRFGVDAGIDLGNSTYPLLSLNRQKTLSDGYPLFENNTPVLDGDVKALGLSPAGGLQAALAQVLGPDEKVEQAYEAAVAQLRQATIDQQTAKLDLAIAAKVNDAALTSDATGRLSTATAAIATATSRRDALQKALSDNAGSGWAASGNFPLGQNVKIQAASPGRLGVALSAQKNIPLLAAGPLEAYLGLGITPAVMSPVIQASGTELDANGNLTASTPAFPQNVTRDQYLANPQVFAALTLDATLGAGLDLSVLSASVDLLGGSLSAYGYFEQTMGMSPLQDATTILVDFRDAQGQPAKVTFINGSQTLTNVTSASFHPGDPIEIQPAPGQTVNVVPRIQQGYRFQNHPTINIKLTGELNLLRASVSLAGIDLLDTDWAYNAGAWDLGEFSFPILERSFDVYTTSDPLPSFQVEYEASDVSVVLTAGSPDQIDLVPTGVLPLSYSYRVTNVGAIAASGVEFSFDLGDADLVPAQSTAGLAVTHGMYGDIITAQIGTLQPGESRDFTISLTADSAKASGFWFGSSVSSTDVDASYGNNFSRTSRISFQPTSEFYPVNSYGDLPLDWNFSDPASQGFLRTAIRWANGIAPSYDRIQVQKYVNSSPGDPPVNYWLGNQLTVVDSLSLNGGELRTILDGQGKTRQLQLGGTGKRTYLLWNFIFRNGNATSGPDTADHTYDGLGGAVLVVDPDGDNPATRDTVYIYDSVFEDNSATTGTGRGGALYVEDANLVLGNVEFRGNTAKQGGGLALVNANLSMEGDVTLEGNTATTAGGGLFALANQPSSTMTVQFVRSSVTGNDSPIGAGFRAVANNAAVLNLSYARSIFDNETSSNFSRAANGTASVNFVSGGQNISSDGTGQLKSALGDRTNASSTFVLTKRRFVDKSDGSLVGVLKLDDPRFGSDVVFTVDDDRFEVVDGRLRLKAGRSPVGDAGSTITVNVHAAEGYYTRDQSFELTVAKPNLAPTDIVLTPAPLHEDSDGATVGTLAAVDPNKGATATFTVDDPRFIVDGSTLKLAAGTSLDFEKEPVVQVNVTAIDAGGLSFTRAIQIQVLDVNEAPQGVSNQVLRAVASLAPGGVVGPISAVDPDAGQAVTLSVDDSRFEVVNGVLKLKDGVKLDRTNTPDIPIVVTATDAGGLSTTKSLKVRIAPLVQLQTGARTYVQHGSATALVDSVTTGLQPGETFYGAKIVVSNPSNAGAGDRLFVNASDFSVSGQDLSWSGSVIGKILGGSGATPLQIGITSTSLTADIFQSLLRSLAFRSDGARSGAPSRSLSIRVVDVSGVDMQSPSQVPLTVIGAEHRVSDYDGDGKADLALYSFDSSAGVGKFDIQLSRSGQTRTVELGGSGDLPIAGDFDGDGLADAVIVQPEFDLDGDGGADATRWVMVLSSTGERREILFGAPGRLDRPAPADFDGDGKTDIATFRANSDLVAGAAQWFVLPSGGGGAFSVLFGAAGGTDLPAVADWDGDGKADIATFRPVSDLVPGAAQWFVLPSGPNPGYATTVGAFPVTFGAAGNADQPALADWDGDGRADITTFRSDSDVAPGSSQWFVLPSAPNGSSYGTTKDAYLSTFGLAGDIAAPGDYDADGLPDVAVFSPSSGSWKIRPSRGGSDRAVTFGPSRPNVVPVLSPLYFRLRATGNLSGASIASASVRGALGLSRGSNAGSAAHVLEDLAIEDLGSADSAG